MTIDISEGGRRRRVTVKDLARDLGMSVSTVSRAFYDDAVIAEQTRDLVLRRAAEIGYSPNPFARSLITKRTRIVGIVVSDLTNPFYPEVLTRLTEGLQAIDMNVMLFASSQSKDVDESVSLLLSYQPDLVIVLAATMLSEAAEACRRAGTPIIFFNRHTADGRSFAVTCDNDKGASEAADHLIERGYRRLGYIAGRADASTNIERWQGFRRRCIERGLAEPLVSEAGAFSYAGGYEAARRLLDPALRPEAVFCANDILAIGCMEAAKHEYGLEVPRDLGLIGFDDISLADWPSHRLTTVRQPMKAMIAATIELVERLAKGEAVLPDVQRLPGRIIERNSTRSQHAT